MICLTSSWRRRSTTAPRSGASAGSRPPNPRPSARPSSGSVGRWWPLVWRVLFEAITAQLKAKAVRVKTGTIVDATIIASASTEDEDGRWVKYKNGPAVHGFKAHVAADADTALVEEVAVTPANVNDGKAGSDALPCEVGEVFADSAYRGGAFGDAVRAKGGVPRIAATACGAVTKPRHWARGVQRGDPARAGPHREDLRHLETQLRPATPAMAGSCQGRRPSSLHRHCL